MSRNTPQPVITLATLDAQKDDGTLYVSCPRCHGSRYVSAITRCGDGFFPTVYGEFPCETCSMTGEADIDRAIEWAIDQVERNEDAHGWFDGEAYLADRATKIAEKRGCS